MEDITPKSKWHKTTCFLHFSYFFQNELFLEANYATEFYETYDGETVVRYKCELTK